MAIDLTEIQKQIWKRPAARKLLFEKDFFEFCYYNYQGNFLVEPADRQIKFCEDLQAGKNIIIVGHRESSKTSYVRRYVEYLITHMLSPFILRLGYDKDLAGENVYNIGQDLQDNKRITDDYGQLYRGDGQKKKGHKKKRMDAFIAENGVYLKAGSLMKSTRGLLHQVDAVNYRPTTVVMDDVDVLKSVQTEATIEKNYEFLKQEVLGGLDSSAQKIILGNVIYEDGLIPRLVNDYKDEYVYYRIPTINHTKGSTVVRNKVITSNLGQTNRSRFVKKQSEAVKLNKQYKQETGENKTPYVSLQRLKSDLGPSSYKSNHLLLPMIKGEQIIPRHYITYLRNKRPQDISNKRVMGVDPAFSEKTNTDPLGITITAHKKLPQYYLFQVRESLRLQGEEKDLDNILKVIGNLYKQYDVGLICIEANNGGEIIGKELQKLGYAVKIVNTQKDKVTRVREREYLFTQALVEFYQNKCKDLVDELLVFPGGSTDDMVDSFLFSLNTSDTVQETSKSYEKQKREKMEKHGGYKGAKSVSWDRF